MISTQSRTTSEEALELFRQGGLFELGERAHELRMRMADPQRVTYIVDRNINYTNICNTPCKFCAFYRKPGHEEGYVLSDEVMNAKLDELAMADGTQVLLQGGHNPDLPFSYYLALVRRLRQQYPQINLHAFSPSEILHFSKISGLSIEQVLSELWEAGQRTMPGGGAEILVDRVRRKLSPLKSSAQQWLDTMQAAHNLGYKTSATMVFGHIETLEERVEHLSRLRDLQDRTGGFTAFIVWPMQTDNTPMKEMRSSGPYEYLRTQAIARIFLDNFQHIQSSWVTMGEKIGQIALRFGADDMGGTMMEENVVSAARCIHHTNELRLRQLAAEAGFQPQRRNTFYEYLDNPKENQS